MALPVAAYTDAVEEHLATRRACGLFDFSFMSHFEIAGANARAFLDRLQTRSLAGLASGRIAYTLLLRPDGSVFIDATVWCVAPDRYWLFTGRRTDFAFVADAVREERIDLRDCSGEHVVLALQGPESAQVLERHLGAAPGVAYFGFREATLAGIPATIGRLGYSGELGYELIVPGDAAPGLWRRLAADARECGFDAANSLRIESGYILFANELAQPANPFELGLDRLVSFDGRPFTGSEALHGLRLREPDRRLVGLDAFAPRDQSALGGLPRAEVTSRVRSPTVGRELALGFASAAAAAPGTLVAASGKEVGRTCRLPFYDPARVLPRGSA
ncbi:MAG TPA: aminomethyltransferase family protein [Burkholderiales bacterium]|nr:aminomethyltransferase family protein [Burkholderiales bacterium]